MPLIVVMDDDASTRVLVAGILRKEGYDVLAAEDGSLGLALIREHKPDLVVSDVQMPNLDGFAVLEAVRSDEAITTTPVILLTSLQDRAHMRQGMTTGADSNGQTAPSCLIPESDFQALLCCMPICVIRCVDSALVTC
jgi:CheY-like chemotaxis protein